MTDDLTPEQQSDLPKRRGLFERHPRLGILLIGALFIVPICMMIVFVFVLIGFQIQNA